MKKNCKDAGITLIALVITIIVLLILAGITISLILGNNGLLNRADKAKEEQSHASVKEGIMLIYAEYSMQMSTGENKEQSEKEITKIASVGQIRIAETTTTTFMEFLQKKNIINEQGIINTEKLLGNRASLGNGTGIQDVYKIEEDEDKYILKYYDDKSEEIVLWETKEIKKKVGEMINFKIIINTQCSEGCWVCDEVRGKIFTCSAEKGMTWKQWVESEYNESGAQVVGLDDGILIPISGGGASFNVPLNDEIGTADVNAQFMHAECVDGDSEILTTQLGKTVKAIDLTEGNDIVYYNIVTEQMEIGKIVKKYIHERATEFVKYEFEDGTYVEVTNYHPIYTKQGWKSLTNRNGYAKPEIGDEVKTPTSWKKIVKIETWIGEEDYYDFEIENKEGEIVKNYFANGTLVQASY